jgi:hypothetical protein
MTMARTTPRALVWWLWLAAGVTAFTPSHAQVPDPSKAVEPQADPGRDAADVEHRSGTVTLGQLSTGTLYSIPLTVENRCDHAQTVSVFVNGLADLTFSLAGCTLHVAQKSCATIVPPGTTQIRGSIKPAPIFYYIDPRMPELPPPTVNRFSGEIIILHAQQGDCQARRDQYQVEYEVRALLGKIPPPPGGPEHMVGAGPCQVWWNTGERPDMLGPEDRCEGEIRPLAVGYRERVLPPYIAADPAAWNWLPESEALLQMSSEALVAMKLRAEAQLGR